MHAISKGVLVYDSVRGFLRYIYIYCMHVAVHCDVQATFVLIRLVIANMSNDLHVAKKRRNELASVGRRSYVSTSALATVRREFAELETVPNATSRSTIVRSKKEAATIETEYGPVLADLSVTRLGGGEVAVPVVAPIPQLAHTASSSNAFAIFLRQRLQLNPPSLTKPWRIALDSDEVTPGNELKPINTRKIQATYWSFMGFGLQALSLEISWFVLNLTRSVVVSDSIAGGMSHLLGMLVSILRMEQF